MKALLIIKAASLIFLGLSAAACSLNAENEPSANLTVDTSVVIQPTPAFVRKVSPRESESIPLSLFESDFTNQYFEKTGVVVESTWGNPNTGYKSRVCIEIELGEVAQPGDDFQEQTTITERAIFLVDETILNDIIGGHSSLVAIHALDSDGDILMKGLGSAIFCAKAYLNPGVHTATFQFTQTSGDLLTYSWQFTIVED
ncbi:MAG: hypothetical protein KJ063_25560 [Anaerolineae bacterium]|nr:hypothetical protein [Anaerolineae bacterium]